jgi:hypothetical protein
MITPNTKSFKQIGIFILYMPVIFLIIFIAIYPIQFFLFEGKVGILNMKSEELLSDRIWKTFFYVHISFGGMALLVGWIQFNKYIRERFPIIHRTIGKVYVLSVWFSVLGLAYIGFYAEGGIIAFLGFMIGGGIWAYTTILSYLKIKKRQVWKHQQFMIYSYAMCVGAVTLRIWLPLLNMSTNDFILSYQLVSWIAWAPNLVVAYLIIRRLEYSTAIGNFTHSY